jgi:hypothetical protein
VKYPGVATSFQLTCKFSIDKRKKTRKMENDFLSRPYTRAETRMFSPQGLDGGILRYFQ